VVLPANFRHDAFAGTAEAYARFREPYPRAMLDDLLARAAVGDESLLDLATGPGRIALDLAPRFEQVVAVDLEPEMIDVARASAARRGIDNVEWHVGRAEDFEAQEASFDLITIGEAFHRLRQSVVTGLAFRWLRPGGCLATLGLDGRFEGDAPWQQTVSRVADEYRARAFPDGWAEVLPGDVDIEEHALDVPHAWTFDELAGYLESTSTCSRRALGVHFEPFIEALRSALTADGSTTFPEVVRWGYTLARKPA
jgi:SAM-dependent methyltransferase